MFSVMITVLSVISGVNVNVQYQYCCGKQPASDATMSLVELCKNGDLEGVKVALKNGADVNTRNEYGQTGLIRAVFNNHNSVVELLLKTPNIDVNLRSKRGECALHHALRFSKSHETLKLLLSAQM